MFHISWISIKVSQWVMFLQCYMWSSNTLKFWSYNILLINVSKWIFHITLISLLKCISLINFDHTPYASLARLCYTCHPYLHFNWCRVVCPLSSSMFFFSFSFGGGGEIWRFSYLIAYYFEVFPIIWPGSSRE